MKYSIVLLIVLFFVIIAECDQTTGTRKKLKRHRIGRRSLRPGRNGRTTPMPSASSSCCPCGQKANDILSFVINLLYIYDYASYLELKKIYIAPDAGAAGTISTPARANHYRQCGPVGFNGRLLMRKVFVFGCTNDINLCWSLCQQKSKCKSMNFIPDANICLLSSSNARIGSRAFLTGFDFATTYIEKPECHAEFDIRRKRKRRARNTKNKTRTKRTRRHNAGGRLGNGQAKTRRQRSLSDWSGVPGVAYFGFRSYNDRIPDNKVLAVKTIPHTQPWLININFNGKRCSGVLLPPVDPKRNASNLVLTAAHCLKSIQETYNPENYKLLLGTVDYSLGTDGEVKRKAAELYTHPDFNNPIGSSIFDLGIIKLDRPVRFSRYIAPIALPEPDRKMPGSKRSCIAVGWDLMRKQYYETNSRAIHHVQMYVVRDKKCKERWGHKFDKRSMICSNTMTEKEASCYGDSGGPLACREGSRWVMYGIVSFGETKTECIGSLKPLISARVTAALGWINTIRAEQTMPRRRRVQV